MRISQNVGAALLSPIPTRRSTRALSRLIGARAPASTTTGVRRFGAGAQRAPLGRPATAGSTASPRNRSDHFAVRSERLDHFGQTGEAEANGNASVPIATSWLRDGRKSSSSHSAALRSVVSNPSVNRS
jgi:hypothetical protein